MSFVSSIINTGHALPYTAVAQAPTVTLPRLKALTTGSNPTFLDAMLNVAEESTASAAFEGVDSWLRQLALGDGSKPSKKVVFAGDDTWLRLFPHDWFAWYDGDTVTVDSNVTRHLDSLLAPATSATTASTPSADWDVLILHYLGLDHGGHLGGPASPLMAPKQREMDDVVKRIYEHLEDRDAADGERSLLVLAGDHGMTEALLFAAPSFSLDSPRPRKEHGTPYKHYEVVQQIDLVPTLSVLFDLGIPKNSMGKLIPSVIKSLRPAAFASGLRATAQQIGAVLQASGSSVVERVLGEFSTVAQSRLLASSSSYHRKPLFAGLAFLILASVASVARLRRLWSVESCGAKFTVAAALVAYLGSFFATSFIEEEHETWYFASTTGLLLLVLRPDFDVSERLLLVASAASVRVMRSWAHNGQKNVPNVSIASYLAASPAITRMLVSVTYVLPPLLAVFALARAGRSIARKRLPPAALLRKAGLFAISATLVLAQSVVGAAMHLAALAGEGETGVLLRALDKLEFAEHGVLARAGYALAPAGWLFWRLALRSENVKTLPLIHLSLLLMSVTRSTNVPLFAAFWVQHFAISRLASKPTASPAVLAFLVAAFQSSSFFALGGSNSLATVDLSQAYNGVTSFSLPLVSLLAFLSNFSGPLFHALSLYTLPPILRPFILSYLSTFHTLALAVLALSATHFRYHLFALTVFAPAVLYRGTWFVILQVGTNLGLARTLMG
ncbi:major facilitator super transporter protein [Rhodotorula kratochvilovae]